jgi:hypothetical protein
MSFIFSGGLKRCRDITGFGGPGHMWQHVDKYSEGVRDRTRQTIDIEVAHIND